MNQVSDKKPSILIVDDTESNIFELVEFLGDEYEVAVAMDGFSALQAVAESPPDLILLDVMMPGMDGYEVCRRLKADMAYRSIPVIFLTVMSEMDSLAKGFQLGAVDYITRPYNLLEVRARAGAHVSLHRARRALEEHNAILECKVAERSRELVLTQDITINSLASLAETRDNDTGGHLVRTQWYVKILAERLAANSRFSGALDAQTIELLFKSAPLHDIGKVGIPDAILLKPGKLDDEEFRVMQSHCELGYKALIRAERLFQLQNKPFFLTHAKDIAYTHHERWDGAGYPRRLAGEDIPLSGRIMAVADVYDTIVCQRIYKPALSHGQAVASILEGRGSHFDPAVVDAFLEVHEEFHQKAMELADTEEGRQDLAELDE